MTALIVEIAEHILEESLMLSERFLAAIALCGTVAVAGCSKPNDGRPKPVPVNGLVLVDEKPSPGTRVVFAPDGHQYAAAGITGADGRFRLQTFEANDGAVPGNYKIIASNFEVIENPNGSVTENHFLPQMYRDPNQSGLTAEVLEKGPNEFTLKLDGPKNGIPESKVVAD